MAACAPTRTDNWVWHKKGDVDRKLEVQRPRLAETKEFTQKQQGVHPEIVGFEHFSDGCN